MIHDAEYVQDGKEHCTLTDAVFRRTDAKSARRADQSISAGAFDMLFMKPEL